jgi:hypothetical protein
MTQITKRILFTATALIVLLTACLPQQQATQDPADIANQVATSVALTIPPQTQTEAAAIATTSGRSRSGSRRPPAPFVIIAYTHARPPAEVVEAAASPAPPEWVVLRSTISQTQHRFGRNEFDIADDQEHRHRTIPLDSM